MNKLEEEALDYLGKHRISELFNHLAAALAHAAPANVEGFLLDGLKRRQNEGSECGSFISAPTLI